MRSSVQFACQLVNDLKCVARSAAYSNTQVKNMSDNWIENLKYDEKGLIAAIAQDYDPQGEYVKHWLPELADIPSNKIHQPWKLLPVEQKRFNVRLGVDYPNVVIDLFASAKTNEEIYNSAN